MNRPLVFLRDDDIGTDDGIFFELASFYSERHIPVVYGVIPDRLELRMISVLRKAKKIDPGLVDIVQHGFRHINYAAPKLAKYEFGARRTYAQQLQDIKSGLGIMRNIFSEDFTPAFIPPYHGYNQDTLKIIQELGFSIFSAGQLAALSGKAFLDLPARVSLNEFQPDGSSRVLNVQEMMATFRRVFVTGGVIGIVFHHHLIKTSADMRAMKDFFRSLVRWRDEEKIRFGLFSDFIRAQAKKSAVA